MLRKVFCYIVRTNRKRPQLLVFNSLDEAGWEVPKGAVEAGETLEEAALREIKEEAGLAAVAFVKRLGVTYYRNEEQHFLLFEANQELPTTFFHTVTGAGVDRGFRYDYRWLDVTPALHELLVQGCNAFVADLLAQVAPGSAAG
jgi:putative (di)nucleoside polyphosphate hydrolase